MQTALYLKKLTLDFLAGFFFTIAIITKTNGKQFNIENNVYGGTSN